MCVNPVPARRCTRRRVYRHQREHGKDQHNQYFFAYRSSIDLTKKHFNTFIVTCNEIFSNEPSNGHVYQAAPAPAHRAPRTTRTTQLRDKSRWRRFYSSRIRESLRLSTKNYDTNCRFLGDRNRLIATIHPLGLCSILDRPGGQTLARIVDPEILRFA